MKDERIFLTAEQAKSLLSSRKNIHTFRNPNGMLIGADHSRKSLIDLIESAEQIEIGGDACKGMGHGLIVWSNGPLFVEVDKVNLESLENALTAKV